VRKAFSLVSKNTSIRSHMSLNMISLNEKLSFSSLYFVSSEYSFVQLINSRSYSCVLIDWSTDENDDDETNDRDENDDEDETNDE
jgi:hypothetical protein